MSMAKKKKKNPCVLASLCVVLTDLSAGLVNVLTDIIWKSTIDWHAGNVGCKTVRYAQGVVTYASTYALVALSLDRLHAIARPLGFTGSSEFIVVLVVGSAELPTVFSCLCLFCTWLLSVSVSLSICLPAPLRLLLLCVFVCVCVCVCYNYCTERTYVCVIARARECKLHDEKKNRISFDKVRQNSAP